MTEYHPTALHRQQTEKHPVLLRQRPSYVARSRGLWGRLSGVTPGNRPTELLACSKNSFKNEVHSNKCPPLETINISKKQHNFTTQETRKRTKCSRRKEITKIRADSNKNRKQKDNIKYQLNKEIVLKKLILIGLK